MRCFRTRGQRPFCRRREGQSCLARRFGCWSILVGSSSRFRLGRLLNTARSGSQRDRRCAGIGMQRSLPDSRLRSSRSVSVGPYVELPRAQRSEQYRTCSQLRDHFLRQVKRRPQAAQILLGRSAFFVPRGMGPSTLHSWQELDATVMTTLGLHPRCGSHVRARLGAATETRIPRRSRITASGPGLACDTGPRRRGE